MAKNPSIPKGTRDFGPREAARRRYLFSTLEDCFKRFGFMPLETPAMELLETLTGKYGDEGDRLLFRILNSGDFLSDADAAERENYQSLLPKIAKKGLRYDLTVPFARFVAMHRHELAFPFRRYQIQPVWRADRPQHGRYQEFYQCDADIIGSDSIANEADLVLLFREAFGLLGLSGYNIHINHRMVLEGFATLLGVSENFQRFVITLDKWDKIGADAVWREMETLGVSAAAWEKISPLLSAKKLNPETLKEMQHELAGNERGMQGLAELHELTQLLGAELLELPLLFDGTLARGLDYYTGCIFEVKPVGVKMGSIAAGGRYANLTGVFGLPGVSGVGISFGADRIYDVLNELNLFPDEQSGGYILFCPMLSEARPISLSACMMLRKAGLSAQVYPEAAKLKKQLEYANKTNAAYAAIIGESELEAGTVSLKNLRTGEQMQIKIDMLFHHLSGS